MLNSVLHDSNHQNHRHLFLNITNACEPPGLVMCSLTLNDLGISGSTVNHTQFNTHH